MEEIISKYGYIAVFLGSLIEGESVILAASAAAYHGYLSLPKVIFVAFCGTLLSDQIMFQVGRRYGAQILTRFPKLQAPADRAFTLLRKYDTIFILSFRFIYGIRNASPIVVGMSGVSVMRYTVLNVIASAIWAISSCLVGYWGTEFLAWLWPIVVQHKWISITIASVFVCVCIMLVLHWRRHRVRKR